MQDTNLVDASKSDMIKVVVKFNGNQERHKENICNEKDIISIPNQIDAIKIFVSPQRRLKK